MNHLGKLAACLTVFVAPLSYALADAATNVYRGGWYGVPVGTTVCFEEAQFRRVGPTNKSILRCILKENDQSGDFRGDSQGQNQEKIWVGCATLGFLTRSTAKPEQDALLAVGAATREEVRIGTNTYACLKRVYERKGAGPISGVGCALVRITTWESADVSLPSRSQHNWQTSLKWQVPPNIVKMRNEQIETNGVGLVCSVESVVEHVAAPLEINGKTVMCVVWKTDLLQRSREEKKDRLCSTHREWLNLEVPGFLVKCEGSSIMNDRVQETVTSLMTGFTIGGAAKPGGD